MLHYVDVILPLSIPYTYTYSVDDSLFPFVSVGKRVVVQFGSKKFYSAIVTKIHQEPPKDYAVKSIEYVLDEEPCVLEYQIKFWEWLSEYYLARIGDVMNAALPAGLKIESISTIQINSDFAIDKKVFDELNEKEKKVIDILAHQKKIKINDLEKIIPKSSIPKVIKSLSEKSIIFFTEELEEKYKPKLSAYIKLNPDFSDEISIKNIVQSLEKRAFKQLEAFLSYIQLSKNNPLVKKSVIVEKSSVSAVNALVEKGVFIEELLEESRLEQNEYSSKEITLTKAQEKAFQEIKNQWVSKNCVLLFGEVGSGKTEIYAELIKEQLSQQKQVLYLVPEIALTTQLITRLKKIFGNNVYVYHSKFSENERTEIWNKLLRYDYEIHHPEYAEKSAKIILGPRSALFLPFKNLGLVIIDEEHDNSFRQRQKHPYYNARDAAIFLASMNNTKVVLGSATPSIETMYNAQTGKYGKVELSEKFGTAKVSKKIIDIRKYYHQMKNQTLITPPLFETIKDRLDKKEQVLIFHNRRGYIPIIQCLQCGWVAKCKNCDVSLVYHKQHNYLLCHYCGEMNDVYQQCPACGSTQLNYKGWGTEKIEEELSRIFPDYSIARLDQDTTRSKFAHKNIIDAFEKQEIDILIGTQMITKGLDFKNVTLVAVLNADGILHFPEFRSFEKAFQLLYQLSGRAGRLEKDGEVYVQTFHPENLVLQMYLENDYNKFYEYVLNDRMQYNYPPFTKLIEITVKSKDDSVGLQNAQKLYQFLFPYFKENLLGPIKPYISKLNNYYLYHLLVKVPKNFSYTKSKQIIQQNTHKIINNKVIVDVIVDA
ncbi:MAG TPA: primosomal protein N' [Bacteroidia bacterium]|nr:primosomal protein N' [Bacteroidia bacterium]